MYPIAAFVVVSLIPKKIKDRNTLSTISMLGISANGKAHHITKTPKFTITKNEVYIPSTTNSMATVPSRTKHW